MLWSNTHSIHQAQDTHIVQNNLISFLVNALRLITVLLGKLRPSQKGRYWVAVSLAEAETLRYQSLSLSLSVISPHLSLFLHMSYLVIVCRRVLHVRWNQSLFDDSDTELALRYSPMPTPGHTTKQPNKNARE